eukprot:COSAG04_NODE_799_length_10204_cov_5.635131_5_plen_71_part_00
MHGGTAAEAAVLAARERQPPPARFEQAVTPQQAEEGSIQPGLSSAPGRCGRDIDVEMRADMVVQLAVPIH